MKAAERTKEIYYPIRDIVLEAKKVEASGKKMFYFNIGDPMIFDFATPQHLVDAVIKKLPKPLSSSYSDSYGINEAREAVAADFNRRKGVEVNSEDVLLTAGASEGITMCLTALLNKGENVLTPNPGYPQYQSVIRSLGGILNEYCLNEDKGWEPDIGDIKARINNKTRAIIVINPNNPTGVVYSREYIKEIVKLAEKHNLIIFSDEIYDQMIWDGEHISPAEITDKVPVFIFNGLSKCYLTPGWRVGWTVFYDPQGKAKDVKEAVLKLARMRLCSNHPMQYAVKPALEGDKSHIKSIADKLRKRGDLIYKRFNEIKGFSLVRPGGAFYAFPKISLPVKSDKDFCLELLKDTGIVTVFGSGFGPVEGPHLRWVFLPELKIQEEALELLEKFVEKRY
ncbi:MAG: aminotransferase class I/II-fold pyridoxal phosphate-dependent enzyme [bacterium]